MALLRLTISNFSVASRGDNRLDVIEKAIRSAFEKGNAEDKGFREKVYRSAFAALDRALQQNPNVTVEVAIKRRKALQAKITEIEAGFLAGVASPAQTPMPVADAEAEPAAPAVEPEAAAQAIPAEPAAPAIEPEAALAVQAVAPAAPAAPPPADEEPAAPIIEPRALSVEPTAPSVEPVAPAVEHVTMDVEPDAPNVETPSAAPEIVLDNNGAQAPVRAAIPSDPALRSEPSFDVRPAAPEPAIEAQEAGAAPSPDFVAVDRPADARQASAASDPAEVVVDPDAAVIRERRRPFAAMFFAVTLFTAGAIGLWWAAQTGLLKTAAERDTTVPNPPRTFESEDFIPEDEEPILAPKKPGETDALKNWISVFTPADVTQVSAPTDASAQVAESDDGPVLRIRSGTSGSAVLFDVEQGVLEQIAGKHAIFDIVASAEEGSETQISVSCNFGELGDCGRKRYAVGRELGEFLFEVELPNASPGAGGTIAISSDISNQGKAVDIHEIRVSVVE